MTAPLVRDGPGALAGATEADKVGYKPQNSAAGGGFQPPVFPDDWLFKELATAAEAANNDRAREWLARRGIQPNRLYHHGCAMVGVARIEVVAEPPSQLRSGLFAPCEFGKPAILVPVTEIAAPITMPDGGGLDLLDTITDLVAWFPSSPDRCYLRTGAADLLNPESVLRAWHLDKPLPVHRNPLEWVQGGFAGTVIVDWRKPLPISLFNCRRMICGDRATLTRLRHGLQIDMPDVRLLGAA